MDVRGHEDRAHEVVQSACCRRTAFRDGLEAMVDELLTLGLLEMGDVIGFSCEHDLEEGKDGVVMMV